MSFRVGHSSSSKGCDYELPGFEGPEHSIQYAQGTVIFRQGDAVGQLHLIKEGAVKIVRSENGERDVIVAIRHRGWLLGMSSAILGECHAATAVSLGRTLTRTISVTEFDQRRRSSWPFAVALERALAWEVLGQVVGAGRRGLRPRQRLGRVLEDLATSFGRVEADGFVKLDVPITQTDLADLIGTTREHVNRLLGELEAQGAIQRRSGWIRLNRLTAHRRTLPIE